MVLRTVTHGTATGVTPAELILNNSIRLSARILAPPGSNTPGSRVAVSDTLDNLFARQHTLLTVAQAHQLQSDSHLLVEYDPCITEYPIHSYVLFIPPVGRGNKLLPKDALKAAGISMEGANLSALPEEPSELVTLLSNMAREVYDKKVVGKEKKTKQKEKEAATSITEKMALAQQGSSSIIKKEVTCEKDGGRNEEGNEAISSKDSSGRKRGRSFMDDFNANVISLLDEDHEEPEVKQQKLDLEKQKLELERQRLDLQDKELFQRHLELEEAKQARKQQGEQMMEIMKLLITKHTS